MGWGVGWGCGWVGGRGCGCVRVGCVCMCVCVGVGWGVGCGVWGVCGGVGVWGVWGEHIINPLAWGTTRNIYLQSCFIHWPVHIHSFISPWTKWLPFCRRYLQMHFREGKCCILIKIALKFVPKGPIDNNQAMIKIMAWRRIGGGRWVNYLRHFLTQHNPPPVGYLFCQICVTQF